MQSVLILVDLGQIKRNLRALCNYCGTRLWFMVKCNAYGHGLLPVARAAAGLVDGFGVATAEEGATLRRAGIDLPVLVTAPKSSSSDLVAAYDLEPAVFDERQLEGLSRAAESRGKRLRCHVKVESGMNRLGAPPDLARKLADRIAQSDRLSLAGCYTHLASEETAAEQIKRFWSVAEPIKAANPNAIIHLGGGDVALGHKDGAVDAVRCGLAAYGYSAVLGTAVAPAMRVLAEVIDSHSASAGESVGYDAVTVERNTHLTVVSAGYGDGLPRSRNLCVELRSKSYPLACSPCMDTSVVLTGGLKPRAGECVTLVADAAKTARDAGTVTYDVLTAFHGRCDYLYLDDEEE